MGRCISVKGWYGKVYICEGSYGKVYICEGVLWEGVYLSRGVWEGVYLSRGYGKVYICEGVLLGRCISVWYGNWCMPVKGWHGRMNTCEGAVCEGVNL